MPRLAYVPFLLFWLFDVGRYVVTHGLLVFLELAQRRRARRSGAPPPVPPTDAPLVSVIMAGYNEADTMPLTLSSLEEQSWPNLEVIVVDDGSVDGTSEEVRRFLQQAAHRPGPVVSAQPGVPWCRLVTLRRRNGKAAALNLGLRLARGPYLVFVDADTTFDRDAIFEIVRPMLEDPDCGAVGGNLVVRNSDVNILTALVSTEYLLSISVGRRFRSLVNMLQVISGAFGAFRRDLVEAVGGHTPTSGNDADLTLKVRRLTRRVVFAHTSICQTKTPVTIKALVKQRRRWDRNLIKNKLRRHRDLLDPRAARFQWANALLVLDSLFFNLVLGLRWPVAVAFTIWCVPEHLPRIAATTYLMYLAVDVVQLAIAQWLQPPPRDVRWRQWHHLPLYPIYKACFRVVRLYAYLEEIGAQASYADVFAPAAVSAEALAYDNAGRLPAGALLRALLWPWRAPEGAHRDRGPAGGPRDGSAA